MITGLDLSLTSTGVVTLFDDRGPISKAIQTKSKGEERLVTIENEISNHLMEYPPQLVVIEGYAYGSKHNREACGELGGVVKTSLFLCEHGFLVVPPARLKKFAGAKKKDQIRLQVYKRWGFEAKTDDEIDAYVLAKIGMAYLGCEDDLTKTQREVVDDMKEGDS